MTPRFSLNRSLKTRVTLFTLGIFVISLLALDLIAQPSDAHWMVKPAALQAYLQPRPLLQNLLNGGVFATGTGGTVIADVPQANGCIGIN